MHRGGNHCKILPLALVFAIRRQVRQAIDFKIGRDGQIRTADPSHPKRVLYQAEPRPDITEPVRMGEPASGSEPVYTSERPVAPIRERTIRHGRSSPATWSACTLSGTCESPSNPASCSC